MLFMTRRLYRHDECGKTLASKAVFPHEIDKADNENDSEFGQTIILTSSSGLIG